jgi:hypothetical protein
MVTAFTPTVPGPPYETVLVGDPFLAMGEDDASTLSTHWNAAGIQAAAEYIWHALQPRLAAGPRE